MDVAVIPIRSPERAKSRLAASLTEHHHEVVEALITDVLALASSCSAVSWAVVTDDASLADRVRSEGIVGLVDEGTGLNDAIALAVGTFDEAGGLLVLPMDLPLATCQDIETILEVGETSDVVIVPSLGDGGTNALLLRPPDAIPAAFGPGSLERHLALAEGAGYRTTVLPLDRLSTDLDTIDDVPSILQASEGQDGATVVLLQKLFQSEGGSPSS